MRLVEIKDTSTHSDTMVSAWEGPTSCVIMCNDNTSMQIDFSYAVGVLNVRVVNIDDGYDLHHPDMYHLVNNSFRQFFDRCETMDDFKEIHIYCMHTNPQQIAQVVKGNCTNYKPTIRILGGN